MNSPTIPRHPLDHPAVTRIALGQAASDALAALGPHCLAIFTKADSTAPDALRGRMVLHCLPCSKDALDAAHRVATGKARAVTIKTPATPKP